MFGRKKETHPAHRRQQGLEERRSLRSRLRENPWWIKFLAPVGAISILTLMATLFLGIGRRPAHAFVSDFPAVDQPGFLAGLSGITGTPVRTGGSIRLLQNGREFFPALIAAIHGARRTVHLSCYIWEDGHASDEVLAALHDARRRRVEVRVLLDAFGGMAAPSDKMDALRAAGAEVTSFRGPKPGKLSRFHKRNHRRAMVIDGSIGFTGGMAVADHWLGDADSDEHWRDTMVEVTGPLAASLQSAFADQWAYATGEIVGGESVFPAFLPADPTLGDPVRHLAIAAAPSSGEDHPLWLFFLRTFSSARQRLWIETPYFVPDDALRRTVADRARAGVDVRILLPDEHTDAKAIRLTSHHYYQELLDSGVRIFEYQKTMNHSKHVVVDGQWSVVGSANMDIRSLELNHENVLGVLDPVFAQSVEQTFLADLQQAREIRRDEWQRRSPWERVKERAAVALSEQY